MTTTQTEYSVDHFGSVLLSLSRCHECGYKHTDVFSLETREPTVVRARIDNPDDLNIKVIKSGSATIKIPEFGATITPGPYSEGFVTNVEGVLSKVEDSLTFMLHSAKPERVKKGARLFKKMRLARKSPHFTLVIVDPLGNSGMVSSTPSKIVRRKLSRRELHGVDFR
jgi:zinc finger protein